jgi:hypothetical protein
MSGVRLDIEVEQNGTFELAVQVLDSGGVDPRTDLAGWGGVLQIRADRDPLATLYASAVVSVDSATAIATATIDADDTAVMTWRSGEYDFYITDNGSPAQRIFLCWGSAKFVKRVST